MDLKFLHCEDFRYPTHPPPNPYEMREKYVGFKSLPAYRPRTPIHPIPYGVRILNPSEIIGRSLREWSFSTGREWEILIRVLKKFQPTSCYLRKSSTSRSQLTKSRVYYNPPPSFDLNDFPFNEIFAPPPPASAHWKSSNPLAARKYYYYWFISVISRRASRILLLLLFHWESSGFFSHLFGGGRFLPRGGWKIWAAFWKNFIPFYDFFLIPLLPPSFTQWKNGGHIPKDFVS